MKLGTFLFCMLSFCASLVAQDIVGFWKSYDEDTGMPQCVIGVYEYEGMYYGRIIGSYDEQGTMDDTIYKPRERAPGIVGTPYYSGLDLIYFLADSGNSFFKGKVVDPKKGNVYNAEVWVDNGNLILRGKLFIFGRSKVWMPAGAADFPKDFKMPDLKKFVPVIPEVN